MKPQQCTGRCGVLGAAHRALCAVERLWIGIASIVVVIMMVFTASDVLLRYGFNAPLTWWYDLLMNYLLTAAFFLPFSHTLAQHAHLAVEYFSRKLAPRTGSTLLFLGFTGSAAALAVITYAITKDAYAAWLYDDVIAGVILWPVWISRAIVAAAMLPLTLRCAYFAVAHLLAALRFDQASIPGLHRSPSADAEVPA